MIVSKRALHAGRMVAALGALGAGALYAQQQGVTLHEYFEAPDARELEPKSTRRGQRTQTREPAGPPALSPQPGRDELIFGEQGPMAAEVLEQPQGPLDPGRAQANKLDDKTDRVNQLNYFPAFDPSVIPYKRVVAQNRVVRTEDGGWALALVPGLPRTVELDARPKGENEDSFWGTFVLRAEADGGLIPIPSVAPTQRILKLEVEPRVAVTVVRDEADNFALKLTHAGPVRVNMLIAAPRFYFDGQLDRAVSWDELDALGAAKLDPGSQRFADQALRRLGVDRRMAPADAAEALIRYFRDFEVMSLDDGVDGKDLYLALVELQRGVCRHRSMAFVITALGLGLPARYVYNEAHAFVEIQWPGQGWRRVDLGGNADEVLMRAGQRAERVHDGASSDPFPHPPAYTKELERMAAMQREAAGQQAKGSDPRGKQEGGPNAQGDVQGEQTLDPERAAELPEELFSSGAAQSSGEPSVPGKRDAPDNRAPALLTLHAGPQEARRGGSLTLSGRLMSDGRPLEGRKVALYLAPASAQSSPAQMVRLGEATTDGRGGWSVTVVLPMQIAVGRWVVRAIFAGEEGIKPAMTR